MLSTILLAGMWFCFGWNAYTAYNAYTIEGRVDGVSIGFAALMLLFIIM